MNTLFSKSCGVISIREVWEHNADIEFLILYNILKNYPYVFTSTKYLGVIYHITVTNNFHVTQSSSYQSYSIIKANVDAFKIIEL